MCSNINVLRHLSRKSRLVKVVERQWYHSMNHNFIYLEMVPHWCSSFRDNGAYRDYQVLCKQNIKKIRKLGTSARNVGNIHFVLSLGSDPALHFAGFPFADHSGPDWPCFNSCVDLSSQVKPPLRKTLHSWSMLYFATESPQQKH